MEMKERQAPLILFLISIAIVAGIIILLWPYLIELAAYIGIFFFILLIVGMALAVAAVLAHLILIPFFAAGHPSDVKTGSYSIDDAKEPGKHEDD